MHQRSSPGETVRLTTGLVRRRTIGWALAAAVCGLAPADRSRAWAQAPSPQAPSSETPSPQAEAPQPAPTRPEDAGSGPRSVWELGLYSARPAALVTGLGTGLSLGWQRGDTLTLGLQLAWSAATEFALTREVRHDDLRLRARIGIQGGRGAGVAALRLGLGPTLVAEGTTRNQGRRAGLTGDDLETSALRLLPGADLEGSVGLRVWEDWGAVIGGGPNLHRLDGDTRFGWFGAVSVAWMPR